MSTTIENIVVGFDLDGVIIDHTQNKMRIALRYGVTLSPEETHAERMGAHFTPDMYSLIKSQIYDSTKEALEAPLMHGAFPALERIKRAGVPFFLVSLQKNPMHASHLLENRGLWGTCFTPENTFFAKDREEKYAIAKMLGVTHFVDDEPYVLDIMEDIPHRILFDTRALFPEKTAYVHVGSWVELEKLLRTANY